MNRSLNRLLKTLALLLMTVASFNSNASHEPTEELTHTFEVDSGSTIYDWNSGLTHDLDGRFEAVFSPGGGIFFNNISLDPFGPYALGWSHAEYDGLSFSGSGVDTNSYISGGFSHSAGESPSLDNVTGVDISSGYSSFSGDVKYSSNITATKVSSVPLPASVLFFLSGLGVLYKAGSANKKQAG